MAGTVSPALSVADLVAERDARRRREQEAEEHLKRKHQEELAEFKKRLDNFRLTDALIEATNGRVRRAFERGDTELMLTSFPSSFCTDHGRAISNIDVPPINKPDDSEKTAEPPEPEWLATLPAGGHVLYEYWKSHLRPGGFSFSARIINYPGGMPGDVGLFLGWPKSALEEPPI